MTWIDKNKPLRRRVDAVELLYIQITQTEIQTPNTATFIVFSTDKTLSLKKIPRFHTRDIVLMMCIKEKFLHVKKAVLLKILVKFLFCSCSCLTG